MSTDTQAEKALARIKLMVPRTAANNCTPAEVESAQRQIGRLVMEHPELLCGGPAAKIEQPQAAGDVVELQYSAICGETEMAVLFVIRGEQLWLPKSQLRGFASGIVRMTRWIATQKGLVS